MRHAFERFFFCLMLFGVVAGVNELFISDGSWRIAIGCFCFATAVWLITHKWGLWEMDILTFVFGLASLFLLWSSSYLYMAGILGAILALAAAISFAFAVLPDENEEAYEE